MKIIKGFDGLLAAYRELPNVGGFFVDKGFLNEKFVIDSANYYLAESEAEHEGMEDDYKAWLEYPTFTDIIENKMEHSPGATRDDLLNAVLYYLEYDDFLD